MSTRHSRFVFAPTLATIATLATLAGVCTLPRAAAADDRSLLEPTQKNPYVFILLDTSGSMHQEVACSATDIANGFCSQECDAGDCLPRMMGDDPDSKIYVAKQSIYQIMASHPNINFGFGHFDQEALYVAYKYWWYTTTSASTIKLSSGLNFPEANQQELFGYQAWSCNGNGQTPAPYINVGCVSTQPAHLDNAWEWTRAERWPKPGYYTSSSGSPTNASATYYFTESSTGSPPIYKVTYTPVSAANSTLGNPTIQVVVAVAKCTNSGCTTSTAATGSPQTMTWTLANQTVYWDPPVNLTGSNIPDVNGNGGAYYGSPFGNAFEVNINANYDYTLDLNSDTNVDPWATTGTGCSATPSSNLCDMQEPSIADASGRTPANSFSSGNIIPLDWNTNQQTAIMQRMAPNLLSGATTPNFGIASYFTNYPLSGEIGLQLLNVAQRPLAPEGGTPTGHAMMSFGDIMTGSTWYNNGGSGTTVTGSWSAQAVSASWIGTASSSSGDPFFTCKPAYVLILTDGLASSDDQNWNLSKSACPTYYNWVNGQPALTGSATPPGFACCAAEALRTITYGSSTTAYPIRTYVIGLGLTSTTVGGYNNTLQCIADEGGTGNRHFFQGNKSTVAGQPAGYPASDPPPASFCTTSNPCDGPGPLLPQSKQDIVNALLNVLNLIESTSTSFAAAAVPSLQSDVANESILTNFLPINSAIWPGRVDAYVNPVPTTSQTITLPNGSQIVEQLPNPAVKCSSSLTEECQLWNAGGGKDLTNPANIPGTDVVLAQAIAGLDLAGTDPTKRRIYYAPQTPISGTNRFNFTMPALTNTAQLYDLENGMGLCGDDYTFYPPSSETCVGNSTTPSSTVCSTASTVVNPCPTQTTSSPGVSTLAQQTITWAESVKTYINPNNQDQVEYILGDIFHSNPQILGQPSNSTYLAANLDNYTSFVAAEQYRRKVLFFGSDDGEMHALDVGTAGSGSISGQPAWTFGTGTGNEIFAFVPRSVMPTLENLAAQAQPPTSGGSQTYMVDGQPHFAEGYFDATGGTNPQWHTLVVGGLREGGHEYYALDVTQPDTLTTEPSVPGTTIGAGTVTVQIPNPTATNYLPNCINGGTGCGQVPYATPLWEFTDSCQIVSTCTTNCATQPCDEDSAAPGKGFADLGQTWSTPNSGRVRICDSTACTTFHDQWVVVLGGGMDPSNLNQQGNYLYMLDMATGTVIYKRPLNGSVPSEVAAVDTGLDGYIDTIYVGTTAGHLYKVNLTSPAPIVAQTGLGNRVSTSYWQPFEIFNTQGRQMYYPPAVFYDPTSNLFGLAWGTGNRQNLWLSDSTTGRFYVMLDNNIQSTTSGLPFTAANLVQLTPDGAAVPSSTNYLDNAPASGMQPGYYFELNAGERVLQEAVALSGILVFNSYEPSTATGGSSGTCIDSGTTRVFVLNIENGNAISSNTAAQGTTTTTGQSNRYLLLGQTLALNVSTQPVTQVQPTAGNPNPGGTGGTGTGNGSTPALATCTSAYITDVNAYFKSFNPPGCRYSNQTINVNIQLTSGSSTCLVPVPVCMIEKNWKEF